MAPNFYLQGGKSSLKKRGEKIGQGKNRGGKELMIRIVYYGRPHQKPFTQNGKRGEKKERKIKGNEGTSKHKRGATKELRSKTW